MDFSPFIIDFCVLFGSESFRPHAKAFLNQVKKIIIEEENLKSEDEINKENLSKFFNKKENIYKLFLSNRKILHISYSNYYTKKKLLQRFLYWASKNNMLNVSNEINNFVNDIEYNDININTKFVTFFKNIEEVINYIDYVGNIQYEKLIQTQKTEIALELQRIKAENIISDKKKQVRVRRKIIEPYSTNNCLLTLKLVCVLAWNGIKHTDFYSIKKKDIIIKDNKFFIIYNKNIEISELEYKLIQNYLSSDYERVLNGKSYHFTPETDFVLKSKKPSGVVNKNRIDSIFNLIQTFNDIIEQLNLFKIINLSDLLNCGLFFNYLYGNSIIKSECKKIINNKNLMKEYKIWLTIFDLED